MPDEHAAQTTSRADRTQRGAFRNLNEQIYGLDGAAAGLPTFSIACECGDGSCAITLTVGAGLYGTFALILTASWSCRATNTARPRR